MSKQINRSDLRIIGQMHNDCDTIKHYIVQRWRGFAAPFGWWSTVVDAKGKVLAGSSESGAISRCVKELGVAPATW